MKSPKIHKDWKYYVGLTCLILSVGLPLFGFTVPFLGLHPAFTAILIGFLTIGGPEVMILLAVLFLGKETLSYYKQKIYKCLFKRRKYKPVSRFRYYFGLIIFFASPTPLYLNAYGEHLLPADEHLRHFILMGADLAFVLSFFILGGNFWEKFKSLFIWNYPVNSK